MPRWTRDPLRDRWVIQAPSRSARPDRGAADASSHGEDCPFCPGREEATPPETGRIDGHDGWRARAFPNVYPAFAPGHGGEPVPGGTARGDHEVIVITPDHDVEIADLPDDQAGAALALFRRRCEARLAAGRAYVLVFVNHGAAAGASMDHSHGQLVGLDHVPGRIRREQQALGAGACTLCELPSQPRLAVARSDAHLLVTPPWASAPGELILFPGDHRPDTGGDESLGRLLRDGLHAIRTVHGPVAYNIVAHPAAPGADAHGHLHVHPRTTRPGGFELGAGILIDPVDPAEAAAVLRDALPDRPGG